MEAGSSENVSAGAGEYSAPPVCARAGAAKAAAIAAARTRDRRTEGDSVRASTPSTAARDRSGGALVRRHEPRVEQDAEPLARGGDLRVRVEHEVADHVPEAH